MPPKKQEEQNTQPYKPFFVLPILMSSDPNILEALAKPVNIKKDINKAKIIEILSEKGLQPFLNQGEISEQGRKFICDNYSTVCEETIQSVSKPPDPKKDAKKDTKKQAKKEEPVADVIPPIQLDFQKKCNDFYILLDFPKNSDQLKTIMEKGNRIDAIVIVKQKIKPGSRKPNYSLLKNQRSVNDMQLTLQNTEIQNQNKMNNNEALQNGKQMMKVAQNLINKSKIQGELNIDGLKNIRECAIFTIDYLKDLSVPDNDQENFITQLFKKLCLLTIDQEKYAEWKAKQKLQPMIQPIKTTVTKQVQVQNQDKGKKGGKGAEPTFETVQQVVQTKYESYPQNIKIQLTDFKKTKQLLMKTSPKIANDTFTLALQSCVATIFPSSNQDDSVSLQEISEKVRNKFEIRPINHITPNILSKKTREITYSKRLGARTQLKFEFEPQQAKVSLMQISQKAQTNLESLKIQFIVHKLEQLAKNKNDKIKWNFGDRKFVEKFTAEQIHGIINQQLLNDPEVYTGMLETEGIRLMVLSRTNPPGRFLYHNDIFDWRVVPDFQQWLKNKNVFEETEEKVFFDYSSNKAGNLSVCSKNMMPRDDSIIKDLVWTIGNDQKTLIQISKNNARFGITKFSQKQTSDKIIYWHEFDDEHLMRVSPSIRRKQIPKEPQEKLGEEEKQGVKQQRQEQFEIREYPSIDLTIECKGEYIIVNDPIPTIFWLSKTSKQTKRSFGNSGSITSYLRDGSICIMYPNGDTSTFRNGKWVHIKNNLLSNESEQRELKIETMVEGETDIQIREDQTVFIDYENGNRKIIFADQTEIFFYQKLKYREIKSVRGPLIRIHMHRENNLNMIGHGSAFAYLGFTDILERSYDGYLFEIFGESMTSHYYLQTYERNGKPHHEEMRLLTFKDSSMIRIECSSRKAAYISPNITHVLTEQYLNERWLQLFTTTANHGEGVFDIDLDRGIIETKDSETNQFVAKVNDRSQAKIAVSFVKEDQDEEDGRQLGNGFHVKQENYFLPPPANSIPARIFSLHNDGGGVQYLNESQIGSMSLYHLHEEFVRGKVIRQYTKQILPKDKYLNANFSKSINLQKFGYPDILKATKTQKSLIKYNFPEIKHRMIEEIEWNSNYSRVLELQERVMNEHNKRQQNLTTIKTNRTHKQEQ